MSHVAGAWTAWTGRHRRSDRGRPTIPSATFASAALVVVLLAACAGPGAPGGGSATPGGGPAGPEAGAGPGAEGPPAALVGGWELRGGRGPDGEVVPQDGHPITLEIDEEHWAGSGGCNRYSGSGRLDGDEVTMSQIAVTGMACMEDGVMEAEAAYLAALTTVDRWSVEGDTLTLSGPEAELEFTRMAPVPDAPLVGTTWQLAELISGDGPDAAVSSVWREAELVLGADGRLSGSTGCNRMMGGFELDGEVLVLGPLATTRMACTDDGAAEQERQVLGVLDAGPLTVELAGDRLVLRAADGSGLGYRAG